jgi:ribonuclease P protein component
MKPLALPKSLLIRKPWEFHRIYQEGKRLRGPQLTIIHLANGGAESRLGISIHGIKTAVRRNRIKRIIREFFRLNRNFLSPAADLVFAVRPGFAPDTPLDVKQMVERMLRGTGGGGKQTGVGKASTAISTVQPPVCPELTET